MKTILTLFPLISKWLLDNANSYLTAKNPGLRPSNILEFDFILRKKSNSAMPEDAMRLQFQRLFPQDA